MQNESTLKQEIAQNYKQTDGAVPEHEAGCTFSEQFICGCSSEL